jgi:glycosyltransferase involved in cell wall biosynthesis
MSTQSIVALLGRRDKPTDGVEEYCCNLGEALQPLGFSFTRVRVPWAEKGWRTALSELREQAASWRGAWVLLQYSALSWSRRGFPSGALRVLRAVHFASRGAAKVAVVFHDAGAYPGGRLVDTLRRQYQLHAMRRLFRQAVRVILTVPAERLSWLPPNHAKAEFIPVGANLPSVQSAPIPESAPRQTPVVAVFGVTGGANIPREAREIAQVVNHAAVKVGRIRLLVLGRHALDARDALEQALDRSRIELEVRGVLPAAEVAQSLANSDVLLFVRGHISSRRGSAIAGIACGLPVVAYSGRETFAPITEAGVVLAAEGDAGSLAEGLARVLNDAAFRNHLRERSRAAQRNYFSWNTIAARYAEVLRGSA